MTPNELRLTGYICLAFGIAFEYFGAPWISLIFLVAACGLLAQLIWVEYIKPHIGGGGPGPLSPA